MRAILPLHACMLQVDMANTCHGMSPNDTREYVATLMNNQMKCEGFQLTSEQVLVAHQWPLVLLMLASSAWHCDCANKFDHFLYCP